MVNAFVGPPADGARPSKSGIGMPWILLATALSQLIRIWISFRNLSWLRTLVVKSEPMLSRCRKRRPPVGSWSHCPNADADLTATLHAHSHLRQQCPGTVPLQSLWEARPTGSNPRQQPGTQHPAATRQRPGNPAAPAPTHPATPGNCVEWTVRVRSLAYKSRAPVVPWPLNSSLIV